MNALVIAAHPDDEVLGVGGTIARLTDDGHAVDVVIVGEGSTSRSPVRQAESNAVAELKAQSLRAAAILGVRDVVHLGLPDNRFDSVDLLDIVKLLEAIVDEREPRVVFTQHGGDVNIDHQLVFRAVLAVTRPTPGYPVESVLAYEVASSTEWAFATMAPVFQPNVFFDIEATLERKVSAMMAYTDEMRQSPHPRSPEMLRARAATWGGTVGVGAAEAFQLIREVR